MAAKENLVSWEATAFIWLGQVWRFFLINILLFLLLKFMEFLTPVFSTAIADFHKHFEDFYLLIVFAMEWIISLWCLRESFANRYSTFIFAAETKETKRSVFGFDRKLSWHIVFTVWWAQTWRTLLVPVAVIAGSVAAVISQHPHLSSYARLVNPQLLELDMYSILVFSFWGTRESLADRYFSFRFLSTPKSFYRHSKGPLG